jgi:NodT family efflux transporter outer membrane factor (OMF) lipoprotein
MMKKTNFKYALQVLALLFLAACNTPKTAMRNADTALPSRYEEAGDSTDIAKISWQAYFGDPYLTALIDSALQNNQELNITLQEIEIGKNEVRTRKGEYLPFVGLGGAAGLEKEARYTRYGAVDAALEIKPGRAFPEPLPDYMFGLHASWELDVWKKLRNARKSAVARYLATVEGQNFMVTNLISEIAGSYYELLALDNLLGIVAKNIEIQGNALNAVVQEKASARVSQLAVNRFEAQLLNTTNLQYDIRQQITVTENRINFLTGRFPQPVARNPDQLDAVNTDSVFAGIPSKLLANRPDVRQAEMELAAAKLDVQVARANFYPSLRITAGAGFQAFNPNFLVRPESVLYSLAGDLMAPLVNRNAIKATYNSANAKQLQAVFNYERSILNAYTDVMNQLSQIRNTRLSYDTKAREVEILTESIGISNSLYRSARADYMEVLLTQREALDSKMELIEIKLKQVQAKVHIYEALGGGWQ